MKNLKYIHIDISGTHMKEFGCLRYILGCAVMADVRVLIIARIVSLQE